ncbi:DUF6283 family protein [Nonomuraea sp. NPDC050663]|uniref:DUF6283 family protein n=1 Tax=Nonomuraea sp. NPDC050663 TaxID=3364370 RepID=UPI0037A5CE6C
MQDQGVQYPEHRECLERLEHWEHRLLSGGKASTGSESADRLAALADPGQPDPASRPRGGSGEDGEDAQPGPAEPVAHDADPLEFRARPCAGAGRMCPWLREADLTAFTDQDMDRLIAASEGDTRGGAFSLDVAERMFEGRRMACHLDQPGTAHAMRLCAGWLAVIGPHHFRARLSVLSGQLPAKAIHPDISSWPELADDLGELLARRAAQLAEAGLDALPPVEAADLADRGSGHADSDQPTPTSARPAAGGLQ